MLIHAECATVMAYLSVGPRPVLCLNEWTHFGQSGRGIILVFFGPHHRYKISRGIPSVAAFNTWRYEDFENIVPYLGNSTR